MLMENTPENRHLKTVFVLGRGRSGTTWVGTMLNAASNCVYKYEPFNPGKSATWESWLDALTTGDEPDEAIRKRFEVIASGADHQVDYPPFLRKRPCPQSPALRRLAWEMGRCFGLTGPFERYARPKFDAGDAVLVKQVNFPNELLDRLVAYVEDVTT